MRPSLSISLSRQRGYTLPEAAITLGVMGIVIAAIWAATSVVRSREPILDTIQHVTDIATNVRGVYSGFPSAPTPAGAQLLGLYPENLVNGGVTQNAWNGTFALAFQGGATVGYGFTIEVALPAALPLQQRTEICTSLATRLTGTVTTNPAGFGASSLPAAPPAINAVDGNAPSFILVRDGATWENVTTSTINDIVSNTADCTGVAFYFRL